MKYTSHICILSECFQACHLHLFKFPTDQWGMGEAKWLNYCYLLLSMWVWHTTVGALNQSPFTDILLVGVEVSSSHPQGAALVCTTDHLTWTRLHVCLNSKEMIIKSDCFENILYWQKVTNNLPQHHEVLLSSYIQLRALCISLLRKGLCA